MQCKKTKGLNYALTLLPRKLTSYVLMHGITNKTAESNHTYKCAEHSRDRGSFPIHCHSAPVRDCTIWCQYRNQASIA